MADAKAIANRIKSVQDTRKITNAMYLISSTKLRKAKKKLEDTKPYFETLKSEITRIVRNTKVENSRYLIDPGTMRHESGTCGILVFTADKGLAGAYNQSVIKKTRELLAKFPDNRLFVVGEYGRHFFRAHNIPYDRDFRITDHEPTLWWARMIGGYIMDLFDRGDISQIYIVYTGFKNALTSEVYSFRMLPFEKEYFSKEHPDEKADVTEYFPSPQMVMEKCIPMYCTGMLYSILVYAYYCEHNNRMMAMDSANQNADRLLEELTLKYNHIRQSSITQEITEISASVKAADKLKMKGNHNNDR